MLILLLDGTASFEGNRQSEVVVVLNWGAMPGSTDIRFHYCHKHIQDFGYITPVVVVFHFR